MIFRPGDRVRIRQPRSEYTGCRGTVTADPAASDQGVLPFGYYVAIDGEVGAPRPFMVEDLEAVRGRSVRPTSESVRREAERA